MENNIFARASQLAYSGDNDEADKLANHTLDKELSNQYHKVWKNNDTGDLILSHRGTEIKKGKIKDRLKDIGSDLALTFGLQSLDPRFRQEERFLKNVENKYQGKKIDLASHSLGGTIAGELGKKSDAVRNVHTFNKGASLLTGGGSNKQINHVISGDPLSNLGIFRNRGKTIVTNRAGKNKHKVSNFFYL